jgi:hypothetical protein
MKHSTYNNENKTNRMWVYRKLRDEGMYENRSEYRLVMDNPQARTYYLKGRWKIQEPMKKAEAS